jgi:hypothetical protein
MFEQVFKNIDDVLWKEAGCTTELDYTEQSSWLLFVDREVVLGVVQARAAADDLLELPPITRELRASHARAVIATSFGAKQRAFLDFVLSHYVDVGVEELDHEKLTPLLRLKYNDSIADAIAELGEPEGIARAFAGFQKYLYERAAA